MNEIKFITILGLDMIVYHLPNAVSIDRNKPVSFGIGGWWTYRDSIESLNKIYDKGLVLNL